MPRIISPLEYLEDLSKTKNKFKFSLFPLYYKKTEHRVVEPFLLCQDSVSIESFSTQRLYLSATKILEVQSQNQKFDQRHTCITAEERNFNLFSCLSLYIYISFKVSIRQKSSNVTTLAPLTNRMPSH